MSNRMPELHTLALLPTGTTVMKRAGDDAPTKWVYQRVGKKYGNIHRPGAHGLQLRTHVIPYDPRTARQIVQRQSMRSAVAEWRSLGRAQRDTWAMQGEALALPGYQAFLRDYMRRYPRPVEANAYELPAARAVLNANGSAPATGQAAPLSTDACGVSASAYSFNFGTTLYLNGTTATGPALPWGTAVYRVMTDANSTDDSRTITTQAALTGTPKPTVIPYASNNATGNLELYGWAIDPGQMLSNVVGRRRIVAGNHTLSIRTTTGNALDFSKVSGTLRAYRVGPAPARVRTLLGSAAYSVTQSAGVGDITTTLALPQIDFGIDETIQYGLTWDGVGLSLGAMTVTFHTGLSAGTNPVQARIDFPGLSTFYP